MWGIFERSRNTTEIAQLLEAQAYIRVFAYGLLVASFGMRFAYGVFAYNPLIVLLLSGVGFLAAVFALLTARIERARVIHVLLVKALLLLDLALVTTIVYFSGGIESRLTFLYLIPCLSAVFISVRAAFMVPLVSFVLYAALLIGEQQGIVHPVALTGYTPAQLAFLNVIRMGLTLAIVVFTALLLMLRFTRVAHERLDERDMAVYQLADRFAAPLTQAKDLLAELRTEGVSKPHARRIAALAAAIDAAQADARAILARTEDAPPMKRSVRVWSMRMCRGCRASIPWLASYWEIPAAYRLANAYGEYRNDIHCADCHDARDCACA